LSTKKPEANRMTGNLIQMNWKTFSTPFARNEGDKITNECPTQKETRNFMMNVETRFIHEANKALSEKAASA
jgi:hypothetical protein